MAVRTESSICRAGFLYDIDIKQVSSYIRLAWRPSLGACPSRALEVHLEGLGVFAGGEGVQGAEAVFDGVL